VAAAAAAAHEGDVHFVLAARAENFLHGQRDLDDTIARLQAYQEAGADVLFAPGVTDLDDLRRLIAAVDRPVNALIFPGQTVDELAAAGVARISVGGAFFWAAMGAVAEAATELREQGTTGFWTRAGAGSKAARPHFTAS
jgi:2-methylisocitrate lyase-like PEP mutase family enzyme